MSFRIEEAEVIDALCKKWVREWASVAEVVQVA